MKNRPKPVKGPTFKGRPLPEVDLEEASEDERNFILQRLAEKVEKERRMLEMRKSHDSSQNLSHEIPGKALINQSK